MQSTYEHTNTKGVKYYLNSKQVQLKNGTSHAIYFFSKDSRDTGCGLPDGRTVAETPNGLPVLKKPS